MLAITYIAKARGLGRVSHDETESEILNAGSSGFMYVRSGHDNQRSHRSRVQVFFGMRR